MIQAEASEKICISLLMQKPEKWVPACLAEGLTEEHFVSPSLSFLWNHIIQKWHADKLDRINLAFIFEDIKGSGGADTFFDNPAGLSDIATASSGDFQGSGAIRALIDSHAKRVARKKAEALTEVSEDPGATPEDLEAAAREVLDGVAGALTTRSKSVGSKDAGSAFLDQFQSLMKAPGGTPGIPTSIPELDEITGGMRKGELWTIGGPSSGGKSVLELQLLGSALKADRKALLFSLEMGVEDNTARLLSGTFGADFGVCMSPKDPTKEQLADLQRALKRFSETHLYINEEEELTSEALQAEAVRLNDQVGLDLVVVDYLQLMDGCRRRNERADEELSRMTKKLKQLAKKLKIPVICASQLNEEGKLYGARAIRHHSNVVLIIEEDGLLIDKSRNSKRGDKLSWVLNGAKQKFERQNHYQKNNDGYGF